MADEMNLTEARRLSLVRKLWMLHAERGETAALTFYEEMEEEFPWLLRRGAGDDYQRLRTDIMDLINEPPTPQAPS